MDTKKQFIYGKHAITEALQERPDTLSEVMFVGDVEPKIHALVKERSIQWRVIESGHLPRELRENVVHQNVIATFHPENLVVDYKTYINELEVSPDTGLVVLGEIQDPHNIGAIIRSAAAFGIAGVLIPPHNQAPISAAVIKVSAGMAFRVPLVSIGNMNATLEDLKKRGFWIYGLEGKGDTQLSDEKFDAPSVIIVGNEATGIREKTRDHCDILLSIPIDERCESLNASVSAGIALHAWRSRRVKE